MKPGAPQLFDDVPDNVALDYHFGDAEKVKDGLRRGRPCDAARASQQPPRRRRDGAARRDRLLRREERALHLPCRLPGRVRAARPARRDPRRPAGQAARAHRQCRRLVRHEGAGLSRIRPHAARRAPARAAGQVDRRALDELPLRQPRPRPREGRRARARRRGPLPRAAAHRHRQHGRLSRRGGAADADAQCGQEHGERLPHAADRGLDEVRVHQHELRDRLSRRRPARGQLLHGAADRRRRPRDGDRPAGAAPAQPAQAQGDPLRRRVRADL